MVRIRNTNMQEIINWHYTGFIEYCLPVLKKKMRYCRRADDRDFLRFLYSNLELLIKGDPKQLQTFIQQIKKDHNPLYFTMTDYKKKKRNKKKPTFILNALNRTFDYDKFCTNRNNDWNAYRLAEKLKVSACPYCNRQFTHTVIDQSKSKETDRRVLRPDFDHFFDKASHPYLALSFYNLIPSCQICNSRMKGASQVNISDYLHPYTEEFGDIVKFALEIQDSSFFQGNLAAAKILFEFSENSPFSKSLIKKAENNIRLFKLSEVYQEHLDYVFELVNKAFVFNEAYLNDLFRRFEGKKLFRNREGLIRLISGNYVGLEDLQQRPLSKLTRDISEQFNLWNS